MKVLIDVLKQWDTNEGNKVLVFSQTKKILNIIEKLLTQKDISFVRMDGDVNLKQRMDLIQNFNKMQSERLHVFLLTTRVGGLGINLTAANKVVIFDPDWNPMVDV